MAASSRFVLYKEQYFYGTIPHIMRMYNYHESGLVTYNNILHKTSVSILVYKKLRIKIHPYTLPVKKTKYKKTCRSAFRTLPDI